MEKKLIGEEGTLIGYQTLYVLEHLIINFIETIFVLRQRSNPDMLKDLCLTLR